MEGKYRYTNIPADLLLDLRSGKITSLMFNCMVWIRSRAGYYTGMADRVRADDIMTQMYPQEKGRPDLRSVQRALSLCERCGYILRPQEFVSKETYPVYVTNFVVGTDEGQILLRPTDTITYREAKKRGEAGGESCDAPSVAPCDAPKILPSSTQESSCFRLGKVVTHLVTQDATPSLLGISTGLSIEKNDDDVGDAVFSNRNKGWDEEDEPESIPASQGCIPLGPVLVPARSNHKVPVSEVSVDPPSQPVVPVSEAPAEPAPPAHAPGAKKAYKDGTCRACLSPIQRLIDWIIPSDHPLGWVHEACQHDPGPEPKRKAPAEPPEPAPPALPQDSPLLAKYDGTCMVCGERIDAGLDKIRGLGGEKYCHDLCFGRPVSPALLPPAPPKNVGAFWHWCCQISEHLADHLDDPRRFKEFLEFRQEYILQGHSVPLSHFVAWAFFGGDVMDKQNRRGEPVKGLRALLDGLDWDEVETSEVCIPERFRPYTKLKVTCEKCGRTYIDWGKNGKSISARYLCHCEGRQTEQPATD